MDERSGAIGFSVLLYDRRGHGESEGDAGRQDYMTLAGDAVAAKQAIGGTDAVHPDRVGYWGLSQGGWLAMSYGSARSLLAEAEDEPWFDRAFLPTADALPENMEESSWIHEMDYDPVTAFENVDAPMLFILGGEDFNVPVATTLDIARALGEREGREIVAVPGASHLMRIEDDPRDQFELEEGNVSDSATYFMVMGEWLERLMRGEG